MITSFLAGFEAVKFESMVTKIVLSCLGLLLLVGCKAEKVPCATGLNQQKIPRYFHIVERADTSSVYTADQNDDRLRFIYRNDEAVFDEDGRYVAPWLSCENIDGFDEVRNLQLRNVTSEYERLPESSKDRCIGMPFNANTSNTAITLEKREARSFPRDWYSYDTEESGVLIQDVYPLISRFVEAPHGFAEENSFGAVYISYHSDTYTYPPVEHIAPTQAEHPPHILVRLWSFTGDGAEKAREILGDEELQGEDFRCADIYYGYFANE